MFGLAGILAALLLIIIGMFLVFFFPANENHQADSMAWTGILIGLISWVIAAILLFF